MNKDLIFLDVDGVLNSYSHALELYDKTKEKKSSEKYPFDWHALENFYKLVCETDTNIVISSTWRKYKNHMGLLNQIFDFYGITDKIVGQTIDYLGKRDREIIDYLWKYPCNHFVVLDDVCWTSIMNYTCWVNPTYGLTEEDVETAKRILKKKNRFNR